MKLYAPKYYERFKCIADKCSHSCCIGWEIDVDADTLKRYKSLDAVNSKSILDSIDMTSEPKFKLCENKKCSNLDESGLCKIISTVGDDYLCDICREHPRFYNYTNRGKEVGLGMACEEACRIILSSDDFDEIIEIAQIDGEPDICDYDAIPYIQQLFDGIKDDDSDFFEKIGLLYDCYDIEIEFENMLDILEDLEYMDPAHKDLFLSYKRPDTPIARDKELTRAFAYFVYRHCSEATDCDKFSNSLNFSIFCSYLLAGISKDDDIYDNARIISEEIEYSDVNVEKIKSLFGQIIDD